MFSVGEWLPLVWTLWHFHFADLFYVRKNATWHSKGKAKVQKAQYDLFEVCCIHLKPPRCLVCCTEPSGEAPLETEKEKAFLNKSRQVIALIIRLSPCIVSLFQPVTSIVGQTFHQRSQFINPSLKVNSPVVMNQSVVSNHCVLSHKRISLKPDKTDLHNHVIPQIQLPREVRWPRMYENYPPVWGRLLSCST